MAFQKLSRCSKKLLANTCYLFGGSEQTKFSPLIQVLNTYCKQCVTLTSSACCSPRGSWSNYSNITVMSARYSSTILSDFSAENLWSSVISVSSAGKKRGRGKRVGRKRKADLNRGQVIGVGEKMMLWPGLNAPVLRGRQAIQLSEGKHDGSYKDNIIKLRDRMSRVRYPRLPPLKRGWAGKRLPGQRIGPPDPVNDYIFEGFDTIVLQYKLVTCMKKLGRRIRFSCLVVTGNKKGLVGYGHASALNGQVALKKAKNRAGQRLRYFDLFEDRTVFHNIHAKNWHSSLMIHKKEKGYGLRCHRAVMAICELAGIEDLHVKVEHSTRNYRAITRAFFQGLDSMESHQQLSNRLGLHLVELDPHKLNIPLVISSPKADVATKLDDEEEDFELNFEHLYYKGQIEHFREKKKPFYHKLDSYKKYLAKQHLDRNKEMASLALKSGVY